MRLTSLALLAVACDGSGTKRDAAPPHDAPALIACTPRSGTTIALRQLDGRVSDGAMLATSPPRDGRLFVVERHGRIRIFENEQLRAEPYLVMNDVPDFTAGGESGLLGLAFHPRFAFNGVFFIFYTTSTANVLARYHASATDYNKAEPTGEVILSIPDFANNHNGGMIEFGPSDGYLYIGTGDGGGAADPCRTAQQLTRGTKCSDNLTDREPLLGKILRIDVDRTTGDKLYGIPPDNPYASGVQGEPEIFISGLRNPWRWSFDRATGDMYIGDVGQDEWEELTVLTPAQQPGANLGWSRYEGTVAFPNYPADPTGVTMPQFVRSQPGVGPDDGWESIIAGQVYRGTCFPDLVGDFYFSDYVKHPLMRGRFESGTFTATEVGTAPSGVASIHADARGELFLTTTSGEVYQIEAAL